MKCPKCQTENKDGAKFCLECGNKFETQCPQCGRSVPLSAKFCDECGCKMGKPQEAVSSPGFDFSAPKSYTPKFLAQKILNTRSSMEGERKLVTVLFADVAGYTSFAEKLDPEQVHQVMDGCFRILMEEIHMYEGTINQFTGDGVMALFGAPVAHEDHARRACHAALSIQKALAEYAEKVRKEVGRDFKMRIGLNSGPVVVGSIGDDLRMDYTAVGDTTNLGARVEQAAKPGEVWISQETRNIVRGYFKEELVGEIPLKGKTQPQSLYRLLSEVPEVRTRFGLGIVGGTTDFVGRRSEMEALGSAYERVKGGEAQVVVVVGEAGVGKSRLIFEFQRGVGAEVTFLSAFCVLFGRSLNLLPVIDVLKGSLGITGGMDEDEVGDRIRERAEGRLSPMIPFYRHLLSLKVDDPKFKALDPDGRKFGTFEAVKDLLLDFSEEKPLVIFLEDVHWMDKLSEEFFTYFSHCIHGHKILMISASRPEGAPPWAHGAHFQRLGLETLSFDASTRIVRNILGTPPLDMTLEKKIIDKAGGNPFFIEEIVRDLLDRGDLVISGNGYISTRPLRHLEIPRTIQGVLAARIDRLREDLKRTVQVASVIGRAFSFRLLQNIVQPGEELRSGLSRLVALEILDEKSLYPETEYVFNNALTHEVAYESLLKQRRREIHWRIAQAIEELYADRLESNYELLAHHYERSGNDEKAIQYLILAGEKSWKNRATESAYEFFGNALKTSERAGLSLDPRMASRAHFVMGEASFLMGNLQDALQESGKAAEISRNHGIVDIEKDSLSVLAISVVTSSMKEEEAFRFFEESMTRARNLGQKSTESVILSSHGLYLCYLGQLEQGHKMMAEADALARSTQDRRAIYHSRIRLAHSERWVGNPKKSIELTEGLVEELRSIFGMHYLPLIIWVRGLALAETGRIEEAIRLFSEGIETCEKSRSNFYLVRLYNSLGFCYSEIYDPKKAWEWNVRSEKAARQLMSQYPMGRQLAAEVVAQASVNLMENLFDLGNPEEAWDRIKSLESESKSDDFSKARYVWFARMQYLAGQILLQREDLGQAEKIITNNLENSRREHKRKNEGRFLRLLGEVQMERKEFDNALHSLREATVILKEVGNPRQFWQASASLASAYDQLGRASEARQEWRAAAEVIQETSRRISDGALREAFLDAKPIRDILTHAGI